MNCPQEAGIRKDLLGTATGLLFGKTTGTRVGMPASELAPTFEGAMDKTQVDPVCDLQDAGRTHVRGEGVIVLNASGRLALDKGVKTFSALFV